MTNDLRREALIEEARIRLAGIATQLSHVLPAIEVVNLFTGTAFGVAQQTLGSDKARDYFATFTDVIDESRAAGEHFGAEVGHG